MKFDPKCKVELCVSSDKYREQFTEPYLDVEAKTLVATNGHVLVAIPVTVEAGEKSGHIPLVAIQWARKCAGVLRLVGKVASAAGMFATRRKLDFPEWKMAIPKHRRRDEGTVSFCINPMALLKAARAIGMTDMEMRGGVCITVKLGAEQGQATYDAILVTRPEDRDSVGNPLAAVMPCRIE